MALIQQGTKLKSIYWSEGSIVPDEGAGESLEIHMLEGQMSLVPWVLYKDEKGQSHLYNMALAEGVTLADEE